MVEATKTKTMYLTYLDETKRYKSVTEYAALLSLAEKVFQPQSLPKDAKFWYIDEAKEIVSISC